jgi:TRAP-type mannitol/chloroaromatic compound transport system permease large subunit
MIGFRGRHLAAFAADDGGTICDCCLPRRGFLKGLAATALATASPALAQAPAVKPTPGKRVDARASCRRAARDHHKGVIPFCAIDLLKLFLMVLFPAITLWLPSTMIH